MVDAGLTDTPEVITVGRVSVDLYAQEVDAAFTDPQTFRKSVGEARRTWRWPRPSTDAAQRL